jgi:hypothetical protein
MTDPEHLRKILAARRSMRKEICSPDQTDNQSGLTSKRGGGTIGVVASIPAILLLT